MVLVIGINGGGIEGVAVLMLDSGRTDGDAIEGGDGNGGDCIGGDGIVGDDIGDDGMVLMAWW